MLTNHEGAEPLAGGTQAFEADVPPTTLTVGGGQGVLVVAAGASSGTRTPAKPAEPTRKSLRFKNAPMENVEDPPTS
jgi:hypothetical protein